MLHGDRLGMDGKPAPMVPFAPGVDPGGDGKYGTDDDIVVSSLLGDVDIRVIAGVHRNGQIRPHAQSGRWIPIAVAEPFGEGMPLVFYVAASDGSPSVPGGHWVPAPSLDGNYVLGAVFADLDGDGYIGITHLDGDPSDAAIEEHELEPIGRRLAKMRPRGFAYGDLYVAAGGPPGAELDLLVAAIAVTGSPDPNQPDNPLPTGTVVMTRLPFYPDLSTSYSKGGAPHPDGLFALELEEGLEPDPSDPRIGESFTLRTDDSDVTLGSAQALSGPFARMGIGRPVEQAVAIADHDLLRPGLDVDGERVLYQILDRLPLAPDADASVAAVQLLPLDRLGNVALIEEPVVVTLSTTPGAHIVSPDVDGDPTREVLVLSGSVGIPIVLDDEAGVETTSSLLLIEAGGAFSRTELLLSNLDLDGSGTVDAKDFELLEDAEGTRRGDHRFDPSLDLNGDGRIDEVDLAIALEQHSQSTQTP